MILLKFFSVSYRHTAPELFQRFFLLISEIVKTGIDFFQIGNIGKQILCIHQIAVDIVKIRKQHFAPEIKLIKSFGGLGLLFKHAVQQRNQLQLFGLIID